LTKNKGTRLENLPFADGDHLSDFSFAKIFKPPAILKNIQIFSPFRQLSPSYSELPESIPEYL
jgi:hypothetical protein